MITLSALLIMSVNAFALEGKGFRILSEKIETSPNTQGGFIPKSSDHSSRYMVQTWSQAYNAQGRIHENIRLTGSHSLNIGNYTSQKQLYHYKYELNCDGRYVKKTDVIEVLPGGYMTDSGTSFLSASFTSPGSRGITVLTEVTGESSGNHYAKAVLDVNK